MPSGWVALLALVGLIVQVLRVRARGSLDRSLFLRYLGLAFVLTMVIAASAEALPMSTQARSAVASFVGLAGLILIVVSRR